MKTAILISFEEYKLLKKKSELYDDLISNKNNEPQKGGGVKSIAQILANEAYNEGLLKPLPRKQSI
jgi:hypothetical protein